jgi:hypothetical protein
MGSSSRKKTPTKKLNRPTLTEEEALWADALKTAIRSSKEDLGRITDWDIAVHAIVAKNNNTSQAIHRLSRLHKFKQRYHISDHTTIYEAMTILQNFHLAHTGFLQAFGKDASGRHVLTFSFSQFDTTCDETRFVALYYLCHALQPDLDSIRKGTVWIGDFTGVTRDNFSLLVVNGARALCRDSYPIKIKDVPCLNTPGRMSAAYAICRPFFSKTLTQCLVLDCPVDVLHQYFPKSLLPPNMGGTQKPLEMMDLVEASLKKRFEMNESFQLL